MAIIQMVDNSTIDTVDTIKIMYLAPTTGNGVAIDSFTAANTSAVTASYKAYVVSATGAQQPQIPFKVVVWGESDLGIGVIDQIVPAGGSLRVECSALDSIYFTVTGREI